MPPPPPARPTAERRADRHSAVRGDHSRGARHRAAAGTSAATGRRARRCRDVGSRSTAAGSPGARQRERLPEDSAADPAVSSSGSSRSRSVRARPTGARARARGPRRRGRRRRRSGHDHERRVAEPLAQVRRRWRSSRAASAASSRADVATRPASALAELLRRAPPAARRRAPARSCMRLTTRPPNGIPASRSLRWKKIASSTGSWRGDVTIRNVVPGSESSAPTRSRAGGEAVDHPAERAEEDGEVLEQVDAGDAPQQPEGDAGARAEDAAAEPGRAQEHLDRAALEEAGQPLRARRGSRARCATAACRARAGRSRRSASRS